MKLSRPRNGAALAGLFIFVALIAGVAGYLTAHPAGRQAPAAATAGPAAVRGVVRQMAGDSLDLTTDAGPLTVPLAPGVRIEALRPVRLAQIAPGDWINAGANQHDQTILVLLGLVVIPQDQVQAPR